MAKLISSNTKIINPVETTEPGSNERASLVLKIMKEKYGDRFDKIYINNNNSICMFPETNFDSPKYFVVVLDLKEGFSVKYHYSFTQEPKTIGIIEKFNDFLKELDKFIMKEIKYEIT